MIIIFKITLDIRRKLSNISNRHAMYVFLMCAQDAEKCSITRCDGSRNADDAINSYWFVLIIFSEVEKKIVNYIPRLILLLCLCSGWSVTFMRRARSNHTLR